MVVRIHFDFTGEIYLHKTKIISNKFSRVTPKFDYFRWKKSARAAIAGLSKCLFENYVEVSRYVEEEEKNLMIPYLNKTEINLLFIVNTGIRQPVLYFKVFLSVLPSSDRFLKKWEETSIN